VIAAAFLTVMAFSTVPSPLYALDQPRDGFATVVITLVFAAYAVGVMASLYLAGHVSDWLGRRRVILAAIVIELLAALLFLVGTEVPRPLVARFISGIGVGALTATAHLSELRAAAMPHVSGISIALWRCSTLAPIAAKEIFSTTVIGPLGRNAARAVRRAEGRPSDRGFIDLGASRSRRRARGDNRGDIRPSGSRRSAPELGMAGPR